VFEFESEKAVSETELRISFFFHQADSSMCPEDTGKNEPLKITFSFKGSRGKKE
jgi:hypothetical protein